MSVSLEDENLDAKKFLVCHRLKLFLGSRKPSAPPKKIKKTLNNPIPDRTSADSVCQIRV